jgi:hypothetical protein
MPKVTVVARTGALTLIEERRKKLAQVEALLIDPELADFWRELGVQVNGTAPKLLNPDAFRNVKSVATAPNATGLKDAILEVSTTFASLFTAPMLVAKLQERHFKFDRNPVGAVRDSLYVIVKKRLGIREAGQQKPGQPKYYEVDSAVRGRSENPMKSDT